MLLGIVFRVVVVSGVRATPQTARISAHEPRSGDFRARKACGRVSFRAPTGF